MATAPATKPASDAPELILGWLWLASAVTGGLVGGLYAAATTKLSLGAALWLLPFLHVVISIPVFFIFMLGVTLVRGFYRRHAQSNTQPQPSARRAWVLLVAWASLHALVLFAMTAFSFLTVLSFTSAVIAWACCLGCAWLLRTPLLAYLMDQTGRRGMSWVDRRYAQVHGNLRDWQK